MVLDALEHDLMAKANDRISRHRRVVVSAFETWWEKYRTSMSVLEAERDATAERLAGLLKELGYE